MQELEVQELKVKELEIQKLKVWELEIRNTCPMVTFEGKVWKADTSGAGVLVMQITTASIFYQNLKIEEGRSVEETSLTSFLFDAIIMTSSECQNANMPICQDYKMSRCHKIIKYFITTAFTHTFTTQLK